MDCRVAAPSLMAGNLKQDAGYIMPDIAACGQKPSIPGSAQSRLKALALLHIGWQADGARAVVTPSEAGESEIPA